MMIRSNFSKISNCISYDDEQLKCVTIYKTAKRNIIRITVDVHNCSHVCYVEVFNSVTLQWNGLFKQDEIPNYNTFQYHIKASSKLLSYQNNLKVIIQHLENVYGNLI